MKQIILLLLIINTTLAVALPIDSLTKVKIESGILYMENNQYDKAIQTFTELMAPGIVLPHEICYFMGNSLYQSGRSRYSIRFLNKYIDLTDSTGVFYNESIDLLAQMGFENPIAPEDPHDNDEPFISVQDDPCQGKAEILCPVCNGTGVVIKKSKYGSVYKTCLYSDEHGLMDCQRYKAYLDGELIEYTPE